MKQLIVPMLALLVSTLTAAQPMQTPTEGVQPPASEKKAMADLLQQANAAYGAEDFSKLEEVASALIQIRPFLGQFRYLLAQSYAMQGKKQLAYDSLLKLSSQGLFFDVESDPMMSNIKGTGVFDYIVGQFKQNAGPSGVVAGSTTLNKTDLLVDGIAFDPVRKQLLVGSAREGKVFLVAPDGELEPLISPSDENGLQAVLDIAVDAKRDRLWVATAAVPQFVDFDQSKPRQTGLAKFELSTGKHLASFPVTENTLPHLLANIAMGPDGAVYAADAYSPFIFRVAPDAASIGPYMALPDGTLRDLVVEPGGDYLFVADYERGLMRVDLRSNKVTTFGQQSKVNLGGIDGLVWYKDSLVAIQNGNQPERVMRIALDRSGTRIAHAQPMLVGLKEFFAPSVGTMVGNELHLVAANESSLYHPVSGKLLDDIELLKPVVLRSNLETGWTPQLSARPQSAPTNMVEKP